MTTSSMDLGVSEKVRPLVEQVRAMVRDEVLPLEAEFHAEVGRHPSGNRFAHTDRQLEILDGLKSKAKERGLWNFWLTDSERGYGLSTVEYAYLAEEMGWSMQLGAETFNCAAPDTGNMEVLERFGSQVHKDRWLGDLLEGRIRSAYLMTEPDVASSDATNLEFSAVLDGDEWVLNGEKHWASGAGDPRCQVYILMAKTEPEADRHAQHSMFAIPAGLPGVEIVRPMEVFGHDDAPHGHMHIRFANVRVPAESLIQNRGDGFRIAQGRLGPGRIHHCMRAVGQAERAFDLMIRRGTSRTAFGKPLVKLGANYDTIAECRMAIEQARLLCLKAAWMMDQGDPRAAAPWISQIKVIAPRTALQVVDEAIQMHGGLGVSQDTPLAGMWTALRTLRFADGPDAVHRMVIGRAEVKRRSNADAAMRAEAAE